MIVDKRGGHNRKSINERFFKKWSSKMAYVLGFIYADGTIEDCMKSSRTCYLGIANTDLEILEEIKSSMSSCHKIEVVRARERIIKGKRYLCKTAYVLRIGSKEIFDDLVKLGLCPRKSSVIELPKIPRQYFEYFLRGYFDGDGCINKETVKKNRVNIIFTSGSKVFLEKLAKTINRLLIDIKYSVSYSSGAFRLKYNYKNAHFIARFIYQDVLNAPYLRYKYEKYVKYIVNKT